MEGEDSMKIKWTKHGTELFAEVNDKRYLGVVSFYGKDLFGNRMYDASAFDTQKNVMLCLDNYGLPFSCTDYAKRAIERAIRSAIAQEEGN